MKERELNSIREGGGEIPKYFKFSLGLLWSRKSPLCNILNTVSNQITLT